MEFLLGLGQSLGHLAAHPTGLFSLSLGVVVLVQGALGWGRSRQWCLAPVLFGLVALAGFMLNPFADAQSPQRLREWLAGHETLWLLAIGQFLMTAASLVLGWRLTTQGQSGGQGTWLALLQVVPQPALLVAMLLWEQSYLLAVSGPRPERVGMTVGLGTAALSLLVGSLAVVVPDRWLRMPHSILSVVVLCACTLLPYLREPLPVAMDSVAWESLHPLWQVGLAALFMVTIGWFASWGRTRLQRAVNGSLPARSESQLGYPR